LNSISKNRCPSPSVLKSVQEGRGRARSPKPWPNAENSDDRKDAAAGDLQFVGVRDQAPTFGHV